MVKLLDRLYLSGPSIDAVLHELFDRSGQIQHHLYSRVENLAPRP